MNRRSHRCNLEGGGQPAVLAIWKSWNSGSQRGLQTLANDGFDTLVLVMSVAMSPTNGNEGCRARNESFAGRK